MQSKTEMKDAVWRKNFGKEVLIVWTTNINLQFTHE